MYFFRHHIMLYIISIIFRKRLAHRIKIFWFKTDFIIPIDRKWIKGKMTKILFICQHFKHTPTRCNKFAKIKQSCLTIAKLSNYTIIADIACTLYRQNIIHVIPKV